MSWTKDPQAVLDYRFDWTSWLDASETITSATVTAPAGITVAPTGHATTTTGGVVTAWLAGGTVAQRYDVVCHVTTSTGREDDRTMTVTVRER